MIDDAEPRDDVTPATPVVDDAVIEAGEPAAVVVPEIEAATDAVPDSVPEKVIADEAPAAAVEDIAPKVIRAKTKPKAARKPAPKTEQTVPTVSQLKDKIMATTKTADFTATITAAVTEAQEKAQAAFEKGSAAFGDANEFAKGNVEALVESSKILASGLQELGSSMVAESKSAFETLTADIKEFSAVKSPADFMKLQSELLRRSFDSVMAYGSKQSEAMLKLAGDAAAPISTRVAIAADTVRKAA